MRNTGKTFLCAGGVTAILTCFLTLAGATAVVAADQPVPVERLSLEQALTIAIKNYPELKLASDQVENSRGQVDEAKARLKPAIRAAASWTYTDPKSFSDTANRPVATLSASLPLDISHQLGYGVDAVEKQSEMQSLAKRAAAARLILNVKNAYYNLLRAYGRQEVSQAAVTYAEEQAAIAVARQETGVGQMFDVKSAQVNLANLNQQLIATKGQTGAAQAALNRVLGLDPLSPVEAVRENVSISDTAVDLSKAVEDAYANRPEVRSSQNAVGLAETNVKLQKAGAFPMVALTGGPTYVIDPPVPGWDGLTWQAGVSLSLPAMDGGAVAAKVRQAEANLQSSKDALEQTRLGVALDVRTAVLSLQEAAERTRATAGAVSLAEESLSLAKDRYEAGLAVLVEVTNAQTQLIQAQFNDLNARYDYAVAQAQLQWATFTQPEFVQLLPESTPRAEKP